MPSPHDPDHTRGASVLLPEEMEETEHLSPGGKALRGNRSRAPAWFWLELVAFFCGLAVLATGLIFFSAWPGALVVEVPGGGLALLALCALVISRTSRPARSQPRGASAPDVSPDLPAAPASPTTPPQPEHHPIPTATSEPMSASAPAAAPAEEPLQAETTPAPDKPVTPPRTPAGQNGQRVPTPNTPSRPVRTPSSATAPRLPALANLPARLPPFVDRNLIDPDANDLGDLLGDVAEQTVLAMLTRGQRGTQRRERMAKKIEAFRKELALDREYAAVANFLESITGLLRAGAIIPASRPLVDPFDGLYEYVLTLIRRKSGAQHD